MNGGRVTAGVGYRSVEIELVEVSVGHVGDGQSVYGEVDRSVTPSLSARG